MYISACVVIFVLHGFEETDAWTGDSHLKHCDTMSGIFCNDWGQGFIWVQGVSGIRLEYQENQEAVIIHINRL